MNNYNNMYENRLFVFISSRQGRFGDKYTKLETTATTTKTEILHKKLHALNARTHQNTRTHTIKRVGAVAVGV